MPKFTNANLTFIDWRGTRIVGGDINGDTSKVIPEKTFEESPKLQYFLLSSSDLLLNKEIHPNAFSYTPNYIS